MTFRCAAEKALATSGGGRNTFQNGASRPPGRSTRAAAAAPATGSTQCQVCPATTASNTRPAGSQASNAATSTSTPLRRAKPAIRASTSTPSTRQPAARNCRLEMPVPQPTSRTSGPGLAATIAATMASG
jgi:hypothetical protein